MLLWMLLACETADVPPPPGPATLRGQPIAFAGWAGPTPPLSPAPLGTHSSKLDSSFTGFITMERTTGRHVRAESSLTLNPDGTASGCFTGAITNTGSVSEYASDDGERHRHEDTQDVQLGIGGRWERSGGWLMLWISSMSHTGCDLSRAYSYDHDGLLMCAAFGPTEVFSAPTLGCHPVGSSVTTLRELALPLGVPRTEQPPPGTEPDGLKWLLFGAGEGVDVSWSYRDNRSPLFQVSAQD